MSSAASRDPSRPCVVPGCDEPRARTSRCRDHAREYERDAHARRTGQGGGDHVPIRSAESEALRARIGDLHDQGLSPADIMEETGHAATTVYRHLRALGHGTGRTPTRGYDDGDHTTVLTGGRWVLDPRTRVQVWVETAA